MGAHMQSSHGNDSSFGHKGGSGGGVKCEDDPTTLADPERGPAVLLPVVIPFGNGVQTTNLWTNTFSGRWCGYGGTDDVQHLLATTHATSVANLDVSVNKKVNAADRSWCGKEAQDIMVHAIARTNNVYGAALYPDGMGSSTSDGFVLVAYYAVDAGTDVFTMVSWSFTDIADSGDNTADPVTLSGTDIPPNVENGVLLIQSLSVSKVAVFHGNQVWIGDITTATAIAFNTAPVTVTPSMTAGSTTNFDWYDFSLGASPDEFVICHQITEPVGSPGNWRVYIYDHDVTLLRTVTGSAAHWHPGKVQDDVEVIILGVVRIGSIWCALQFGIGDDNVIAISMHLAEH